MKEYVPGTSMDNIREGLAKKTSGILSYWEDLTYEMSDGQQTLPDLLHQSANLGVSVRSSARQLGIDRIALTKIYMGVGIPVLSQAEASRTNWQDPEFRQRNAEATRAMLEERWQDPEFRQRNAEAVRTNWQDPEFRQRNAEATRAARLSEANQGRYVLPTIQGERSDTGYALSAWEANITRVLQHVGREFIKHQPLRLTDGSIFDIDFITIRITP